MRFIIRLAPLTCFFIIVTVNQFISISTLANDTRNIHKPPIAVNYLTSYHPYFPALLKLALDKSANIYGPYTMIEKPWLGPKQRMRKLLSEQKHIDVIWGTSSPAREKELKAIKINILKGLNQYRLLLIHPNTQEKFSQINTLAALKKVSAIVGAYWQDAEIMTRNQLPVVTALNYQNAIAMFAKKRADYFPRGIYEVWQELTTPKFSTFILEQTLMLKYSAQYYFFVNNHNHALADRIETGLKLAQQDGSFEQLFFSYPEFEKGWQVMSDTNRKIIYLP